MKRTIFILFLCLASVLSKSQIVPAFYNDTIPLTSSEVSALFTTPKQLVPAPGPNKIILVQKVAVAATFNTTKFISVGGTTNVVYGSSTYTSNSVNACSPMTAVITQVSVLDVPVNGLSASGITRDPAQLKNQPLSLVQTKAISGSGDTTLKVYITYQIIDL